MTITTGGSWAERMKSQGIPHIFKFGNKLNKKVSWTWKPSWESWDINGNVLCYFNFSSNTFIQMITSLNARQTRYLDTCKKLRLSILCTIYIHCHCLLIREKELSEVLKLVIILWRISHCFSATLTIKGVKWKMFLFST